MYTMTDQKQWKGRIDSTTNTSDFRLHQQVKRVAINDVSASDKKSLLSLALSAMKGYVEIKAV